MSDEIKLTLTPDDVPAPKMDDAMAAAHSDTEMQTIADRQAQEASKQAAQQASQFDESSLTEEEKKIVDDFSKQIDLTNSSQIIQYGASAQQKVASFSESALEGVKTKDLGEVGNMISDVVTELKSFDIDEEDKGFLGFFKKSANKATAIKAKYAKAETNIDTIVEALEKHQVTLMKDIATLDKLYDMNMNYYKELSMYIIAGKKKLKEVETVTIPELRAKAEASGKQEDAQAVSDMLSLADRFDKKLNDLELTRIISMQMAPQIRLVQNNDVLMTDKIQSTIVNTIPLWKSQMVIAMGLNNSQQAAKATGEVTELTNEMLKKNAANLKTASIDIAKQSERGIVDVETLKNTNEQLISTLDEVLKIQTEGRARRKAAEGELAQIENEVREKLLNAKSIS